MVNVPIAAETLWHIGALPVTNAWINSTVAVVVLLIATWVIRRRMTEVPGRFQNFVEILLETLLGYFDRVTNDRVKSKRFLPIAGTMFFFILLSNWMGLMPGTGSIGVWHEVHGTLELVPILRPAMSDLNLTLALAILSIVLANAFAIGSLGFLTHLGKFIQLQKLGEAVLSLSPIKVLVAFVEFAVGLLEIISEFAKVASLSLRLFGNIFAGEVLITVIGSMAAFFIPLPFMLLELLVGLVQASVFTMLTVVYLTVASAAPHGEHEGEHAEDGHAQPAHA